MGGGYLHNADEIMTLCNNYKIIIVKRVFQASQIRNCMNSYNVQCVANNTPISFWRPMGTCRPVTLSTGGDETQKGSV